jgi:hypothetical protein
MLTKPDHRRAIRTLQGWATTVLLEAGAIRECEQHGWMLDRSDPHARTDAVSIAHNEPPPGVCADEAVAAIEQMLDSIGDCCPECPPAGD